MNMQYLIACALALITLGLHAEIQQRVDVEVPCYARDASGKCTSWGALVQGCYGPCGLQAFNYLGRWSLPCVAGPGGKCEFTIPISAAPQVGTTTVKIPCIINAPTGQCLRWGAVNQGCIAPANGTCKTLVSWGDRTATCTGQPGAQCNSSVRVQVG